MPENWIDFTNSDDFIELTDEQWHLIGASGDGHSAIVWIDGKKFTKKGKRNNG